MCMPKIKLTLSLLLSQRPRAVKAKIYIGSGRPVLWTICMWDSIFNLICSCAWMVHLTYLGVACFRCVSLIQWRPVISSFPLTWSCWPRDRSLTCPDTRSPSQTSPTLTWLDTRGPDLDKTRYTPYSWKVIDWGIRVSQAAYLICLKKTMELSVTREYIVYIILLLLFLVTFFSHI